jgi:hypothetical protein
VSATVLIAIVPLAVLWLLSSHRDHDQIVEAALQQQGVVAKSTGFGALVDELRIHLRRDTA